MNVIGVIMSGIVEMRLQRTATTRNANHHTGTRNV